MMKRSVIFAIIAIILLAIFAGPYLLLLLIAIPIANFFIHRKQRMEKANVMYANIEEVEQRYGEPDDVVVLDASRANELTALILFYPAHDVMVVAGEELKISDMVSVSPKNMATPYTVDEYAVIISTKNPYRPSIYLRVGYDIEMAREVSAQIDHFISNQTI